MSLKLETLNKINLNLNDKEHLNANKRQFVNMKFKRLCKFIFYNSLPSSVANLAEFLLIILLQFLNINVHLN